jgi:hypothetical protein
LPSSFRNYTGKTKADHAGQPAAGHPYCRFPVNGADVPCEFVNVTVTDPIAVTVPLTFSGTVTVNWLPKDAADALAYHAAIWAR